MQYHETKHSKKKREERMINIFWGVLIVPTLAWILICVIGLIFPGVRKTIDFDLNENRNKAKWPTTFSSDYFQEVEDYYDDRVPFRSILISANDHLGYLIEAPYENGLRPALVALFHKNNSNNTQVADAETESTIDFNELFGNDTTESATEPESEGRTDQENASDSEGDDSAEAEPANADTDSRTDADGETASDTASDGEADSETESATEETLPIVLPEEDVSLATGVIDTESYFPPVVKNDYTLMGRGDWLFLYGNANIDYYLGSYRISEEDLADMTASMVRLDEICKAQGKQLAYLMPPSKEEVYSEYMPSYEITNDYKRPQQIEDYVTANSDVNFNYPLEELKAIKPYYLCYLKYDTHWNYIGAFIGYQLILKMLDMPTTNLLNCYVSGQVSGGGDLIAAGSLDYANYNNDRVYTIAYKTSILPTSTEGAFGSETEVYHVTSDAESGKKLVLIGDSYRTHLEPFVYRDFSDVAFIHVNLLGDPTADEYIRNADCIVYVYVERNDGFIKKSTDYVSDLLSR